MAKFPALPLFTDAYMADTRHLTTLQHGAYLLMLMTAWRMPECSLPDDDIFLSRVCGLNKRTWLNNKPAITAFWKKDDKQNWYQGRLKDERNYVEQVSNKNTEAGKASALKRKNRALTSVEPNVNVNSTPTLTPIPKIKDNTNVLSKKVSLQELSTEHIAEWLNQKRALGKYLSHDEVAILERFKDYCLSKGKKYNDYIAAYRNAFEWDTSQPKQKSRGDPATNALNAAQSIIARRNAAAGIGVGAEPANDAFAANLRLPENIR